YRSLREKPGLMMIHAGCVAILAGGLWGGAFSHEMAMEEITVNGKTMLYGKIYKTAVQIPRGGYIDTLHTFPEQGARAIVPLGFKMFLKDFVIEYYPDGQVKDYISHIMIIADSGRHFGPYQIEVNKPLYFGGYHFYQHSFDQERGQFTILTVASDDGLWLVYAGYFLLLSGVFWHLWLDPLLKRKRSVRSEGANAAK
ncbi:MAG: cytochrome c biogenesis protein ResB, partial [Sedimentisphaerales bacterium]|nr:cytochrome c biogenesis protein ResB [Sedimentisphaerales bacterium]